DGWFNRGVIAQLQGDTTEAIRNYRQSIEVDSTKIQVHKNLGILLFNRGLLDQASTEFARTARLAPGDADAWNNVGAALMTRGHYAEAAEQFRRALALRPGLEGARINLERATAALGDSAGSRVEARDLEQRQRR